MSITRIKITRLEDRYELIDSNILLFEKQINDEFIELQCKDGYKLTKLNSPTFEFDNRSFHVKTYQLYIKSPEFKRIIYTAENFDPHLEIADLSFLIAEEFMKNVSVTGDKIMPIYFYALNILQIDIELGVLMVNFRGYKDHAIIKTDREIMENIYYMNQGLLKFNRNLNSKLNKLEEKFLILSDKIEDIYLTVRKGNNE